MYSLLGPPRQHSFKQKRRREKEKRKKKLYLLIMKQPCQHGAAAVTQCKVFLL